ncbi:MAG TPA: PfkB family carbohydrate kinase, partial [Clostridia bacterium]|nr:PfkB family carbohydrate kinase [Clostridia bacterium]
KRVGCLIITRGAEPTLCLTASDNFTVPTLRVKPVDTVGAGDAFAGTFAARRAEGMDLRTAVSYANCAGALATLKAGAQESIPDRVATEKAVRRISKT